MVALKSRKGASVPDVPVGERIYAIGDVHGRLDLLDQLLALIFRDNAERPEARVTVILLGDLIDRGPDSMAVVESCRALARKLPRFVVLKGNHEAMMVDALRGNLQAFVVWMKQGGKAALESWGMPPDLCDAAPMHKLIDAARRIVSDEQLCWLDDRPLTHRAGNCLFVHAGIRPGIPLAQQVSTDLLWIRDDFTNGDGTLPYIVVHGHSIREDEPSLRNSRFGIDTGAYRTGRLTALGLERDRSWTIATAEAAEASGVGSVVDATSACAQTRRDAFERSVSALLAEHAAPPFRRRLSGQGARFGVAASLIGAIVVGTVIQTVATRDRPLATGRPMPIEQASTRNDIAATATSSAIAALINPDRRTSPASPSAASTEQTPGTSPVRSVRDQVSLAPIEGTAMPTARTAPSTGLSPEENMRPAPLVEQPEIAVALAAPTSIPAPNVDAAGAPVVEPLPSSSRQPSRTTGARRRLDAIDLIRQLRRQ